MSAAGCYRYRGWLLAALLLLTAYGWRPAYGNDRPYEPELRFASGLVRLGFSDFAERVIETLLARHPEARPQTAAVRIEMLSVRGRFDESRAIIAAMPPDTAETISMQLALGNAFYAWNRITEAREIYDAFFARFPQGPSPELSTFYKEAAYRYAQMLINSGQEQDALRAYGYILLTEPEREIKRRIQTEMAELAVRLGTRSEGSVRDRFFAQARQLCSDIQWGGRDLWFGRTVVILTQIEVANGNHEKARSLIGDYLPMLMQIDAALRAEKAPLRFSPIAECRYQLGMLHLRDAEALLSDAETDAAVRHLGHALRHLHNVFIQYPGSAWAMEAGMEARRIVHTLEGLGRQVRIPPFDMAPVIRAQIQEAGLLMEMNDFDRAETVYRSVLNLFPEEPTTVPLLADLARCYIETDNLLYAGAVIRHLAERFHVQSRLTEDAGTALLRTAAFFEAAGQTEAIQTVHDLFLRFYPRHTRAPALLMNLGETAFREGNYAQALAHFETVRERYPDSRSALDAMSRIAASHSARGDHTNAIPVLTDYLAALTPGPNLLDAHSRLGDAYRQSGQFVAAAREYDRLTQILGSETRAAAHAHAAADQPRQRAIYERSLFWRAFCLSRIGESEAHQAQARNAAIAGYSQLLEIFPQSELAPTALSMQGALLLVLGQPEEATRVYDRLAREYPDSEPARNAVFAQGSSLIELGQMQRALEVFEQMFESPDAFTPAQFLRIGRVMLAERQYATADRALEIALTATDRATWESATLARAQTLTHQERFDAAAVLIETLLERYPTSAHAVEANYLLSTAYAQLGAGHDDASKRTAAFQKSLNALRTVRRITHQPVERARADYELAGVQLLMGRRNEALASFLRLFLLGDIKNPEVRPQIERAYAAAIPLLFESQQYDEALDTSQLYLEWFPSGRLSADARRWRDRARILLAQTGGDTPEPLTAGNPTDNLSNPASATDLMTTPNEGPPATDTDTGTPLENKG